MLTIIDYGVGNLASIKNMLNKIGVDSLISSQKIDILAAKKLILPGVGSFDYGMQQIKQRALLAVLHDKVIIQKTPILGLCLGVQLLTEGSEEGKEAGLGWVKGKTISFNKSKLPANLKVPHMGWTDVKAYERSKLFTGMYDEPRFYFVHSYHLQLEQDNDVMAVANYGYDFTVGVEHGNILGVQFHPEKSHKFGMRLFENFVKYY